MLKRSIIATASLLLSLVWAYGSTDDFSEQFKWRQPLKGKWKSGQLYRLKIPGAVFDGCLNFPVDLRVMDEEGNQWPFMVWEPRGEEQVKLIPVDLLNLSVIDEPERYVRQDLDVRRDPGSGKRRRHNRISVHTSGRDFVRRVQVYGSDDHETWGLLGEGYLVDHAQMVKIRNRVLEYPESNLPYLQVRVYPNAKNSREEFRIHRVFMDNVVRGQSEQEDVAMNRIETHPSDDRQDCQVLIFDVGGLKRPIEFLSLQLEDKEFARSVRVYGRNAEGSLWRRVTDGEIHRFGGSEQSVIKVKHFAHRYLKMEIYHYDDPPLKVHSVAAQAYARYLVFEVPRREYGHKPVLFYGAYEVEPVRFDLGRRRGSELSTAIDLAYTRERVENIEHRPSFIARHGKWLAALVVGLVGVAVIWVIVRMMKKTSDS